MQERDAGHLGRRRKLIDGRPQRRASARSCLASPGWPGGARAGGTSSSRRGSSGSSLFTAFPMIATFVFTFTNINLAQAEPLQFVGLQELRDAAQATSRSGPRSASRSSSRLLALPVAVDPAVRRRAAAALAAPSWARRLPGPVLPAVRRAVRGRRVHLAGHAQPGHRLGQRRPRGDRRLEPARLARGPGLDLPGPRDHRALGHRRRDDRLPRRAARASRPTSTTRPGSTAPGRGRRCATSRSR